MRLRACLHSLVLLAFPIGLGAAYKWANTDAASFITEVHDNSLFVALFGGNMALAGLLVSVVSVLLLYTQHNDLIPLQRKGNVRNLIRGFTQAIYVSLAGLPVFLVASVTKNFWAAYVGLSYFGLVLYQVLLCVDRLEKVCLILTKVTLQDSLEDGDGEDEAPTEDEEIALSAST